MQLTYNAGFKPNLYHQYEHGKADLCGLIIAISFPFSGKINEINNKLEDSPEIVNSDPYGDGWLIKIELSNIDEKDVLMTASSYEEYIK